MCGTFKRENREIPRSPVRLITGRAVWETLGRCGGTPEMHERGKSDRPVVPANPPKEAAAAEVGEERGRAKGNTDSKPHPGHSAGQGASHALDRVREVARRDKDARFTALLHHVRLSRLRAAYWAISPKAAPGVDGVTWAGYGQGLDATASSTTVSLRPSTVLTSLEMRTPRLFDQGTFLQQEVPNTDAACPVPHPTQPPTAAQPHTSISRAKHLRRPRSRSPAPRRPYHPLVLSVQDASMHLSLLDGPSRLMLRNARRDEAIRAALIVSCVRFRAEPRQ
jgi:hypothetical protein